MFYPYGYKKKERKSNINTRLFHKIFGGILLTIGVTAGAFFLLLPLFESYLKNSHSMAIVKAVGDDFENDPGMLTAFAVTTKMYAANNILGAFDEIAADKKKIDHFYLSIPELLIKKQEVEPNSKKVDPSDRLIHIVGTALPGSTGNIFITGHSTFKYLFDPKNVRTIFSTLDNLKEGSEIIINYDDETLVYKVIRKEILKVEEVYVYKEYFPKFLNKQTVTLMTCWPEGTTKYRLLVTAELQED